MEKKKYEMPQVEVRELEGEVLMQAISGEPKIINTSTMKQPVRKKPKKHIK